jgi:hypothetical protein
MLKALHGRLSHQSIPKGGKPFKHKDSHEHFNQETKPSAHPRAQDSQLGLALIYTASYTGHLMRTPKVIAVYQF